MPEYGRHIHEMVDSLMQIEDRRERNRQARAVIAVMGNLNPLLRDTADFTHKLWDHLFIMSDFQLDVDSPYPQPSRQELTTVPRRMPYSSGHIEYKHYGKYVERMIRRLADEKNPQVVSRTVDNLARYMRTKSYEYNQEHPNNEVIIKDIKKCPEMRSKSTKWLSIISEAIINSPLWRIRKRSERSEGSAATATEESESASVAQFQRQERGRTAQYLEIGFRFLINHFLATCAADFLFRSFFWQGRSWRFPVTLLRLRFRVV